jgi:hypothetical protein
MGGMGQAQNQHGGSNFGTILNALFLVAATSAAASQDQLHQHIDSVSTPVEQKWEAWKNLYDSHDSAGFEAFKVRCNSSSTMLLSRPCKLCYCNLPPTLFHTLSLSLSPFFTFHPYLQANEKLILAHNAKDSSFKLGHNRFSDVSLRCTCCRCTCSFCRRILSPSSPHHSSALATAAASAILTPTTTAPKIMISIFPSMGVHLLNLSRLKRNPAVSELMMTTPSTHSTHTATLPLSPLTVLTGLSVAP